MIDLEQLSDKELLEYEQRLEYDVVMNNSTQLARKVQLNSAYGAFGNQFFRYYDIRLAEAVTKSGQLVIRLLMKRINEYLNELLKTINVDYVVAVDTDSLVITLEKLIDKIVPKEKQSDTNKVISVMDKVCKEYLQPVIDKTCDELKDYLNVKIQAISMKREVLADRAIWVTKKRYVMSVLDEEDVRYSEPHYKIMGIEAVRTSTPTVCRQKIKEALKIVLHGTESELQTFIENFEEEFKKLPPEDVAFPRSVNGLVKYRCDSGIYTKGTPIHVKGSLLYNFYLKKKNLTKKYETIKEGDKIKFLYLKEPNIIKDSVVAFTTILPKELELESFVDYDMQFEKTFIEPLTLILNILEWKPRRQKNLSAFFD